MAYIAFNDFDFDNARHDRPAPRHDPAVPAAALRAEPSLSALEWSVVALAEHDHPSTLRAPGRLALALGRLFGNGTSPNLADPRLEALRRVAVLTWRYGYLVPSSAIRDFVAAGFTLDQYELLLDSIRAARPKRIRRTA